MEAEEPALVQSTGSGNGDPNGTTESKYLSVFETENTQGMSDLVVGKYHFQPMDVQVVDYDSDESFCCASDDDDDDHSDSSGSSGDYDLELAEEESDEDDEIDYGNIVCDGDDDESFIEQLPWRGGVVDLEGASKWDFATLTKNCKDITRETIARVVSFTGRMRRVEEFRAMLQARSAVEKKDLDKIFLNLEDVLKLQAATLNGFRKELLKRPLKPRIGHVLKTFAPFLKLYEEMASKVTISRKEIQHLCDKNPEFRSAHERFQATGLKLSLADLLYEPYKYIVDIKEQLRRYINHQYHGDYKDAEYAFQTVQRVLQDIDEKTMEYYTGSARMLEIRPLLKSKNIEIMKSHRILKLEGKLCLISPQNRMPLKCEVFLFNDVLMLCTPYLIESCLSSVRIIGMRDTVITKSEEDGVIVIYSPDKVVELLISGRQIDHWHKVLSEVASPPVNYEIRQNNVWFDAPVGSRAPLFLPTSNVRSCMLCKEPFARRTKGCYHCHACGQVVCAKCSSHKVSLQYQPATKAPCRVCDNCWRHLQLHHSQ